MPRRCRVVPAILTDDPKQLVDMFRRAETFASYVQVDIMDGHFVPSRSISYRDLDGLKTRLKWEVHLMVNHPRETMADLRRAGAARAVCHYEATDETNEVISLARSLGLGIGLAINPETPAMAILPLLADVDNVLLLSVNPGFYGSPFIPDVLGKVAALREARPNLEIGIDGGIKESNIAMVAHTGVDIICVGSAIFQQPDPAASFHRLQSLADEGSGYQPP